MSRYVGNIFYWQGYGKYIPTDRLAAALSTDNFKGYALHKTITRALRLSLQQLEPELQTFVIDNNKLYTTVAICKIAKDRNFNDVVANKLGAVTVWKTSEKATYDGAEHLRMPAMTATATICKSRTMEEVGRFITEVLYQHTSGTPLKDRGGIWFIPELDLGVVKRLRKVCDAMSGIYYGVRCYEFEIPYSKNLGIALDESIDTYHGRELNKVIARVQSFMSGDRPNYRGLPRVIHHAQKLHKKYAEFRMRYVDYSFELPRIQKRLVKLDTVITHATIKMKMRRA